MSNNNNNNKSTSQAVLLICLLCQTKRQNQKVSMLSIINGFLPIYFTHFILFLNFHSKPFATFHAYYLNRPLWNKNKKKIKTCSLTAFCICSCMCERFVGTSGRLLCYYPAALKEGRGQQAVCLCLSVSKPISQNGGKKERGCDLAQP